MPENEKAKLSAELMHEILGEYVEKAAQGLRRHEQSRSRLWGGGVLIMVLSSLLGGLGGVLDPKWGEAPILIATGLLMGLMLSSGFATHSVVKQDLALTAWQLRRIYELASRHEDAGPEIDPALRMGLVLKLGEAQLLLRQLSKFEAKAKDGRFEHLRSLDADPLELPRDKAPPRISPDLATTQH